MKNPLQKQMLHENSTYRKHYYSSSSKSTSPSATSLQEAPATYGFGYWTFVEWLVSFLLLFFLDSNEFLHLRVSITRHYLHIRKQWTLSCTQLCWFNVFTASLIYRQRHRFSECKLTLWLFVFLSKKTSGQTFSGCLIYTVDLQHMLLHFSWTTRRIQSFSGMRYR